MTVVYAVARALHFANLMGAFGASALLFQMPAGGERLRRPLSLAALVALVTSVICLCFATAEMTGDPDAVFDIQVISSVAVSTFYGQVFFLRLLLLIGLFLTSFSDRAFALKIMLAGTALAALSLTSHAAASGEAYYLHSSIDALHLLTAGFWVGGLMVLVHAVLAMPHDRPRLIGLLRAFSRWGAPSVAVLLAAGTANGLFILGAPGMRWAPTYITLLAIKIVLAGIMVALALTNRFGVLPGLERGEREAAETIPLTVIAELSCAVTIVVIVGFLGVISPMQM